MRSSPRTGGRLLAASAALTCAGILLLYAGLRPQAQTTVPRPTPAVVQSAEPGNIATTPGPAADGTPTPPPTRAGGPSGSIAANAPAQAAAAASAAPSSPAGVRHSRSPLPHPESGDAADRFIQQAMEQASRPDLEPADEELLLQQGRTAWLAETAAYTQVRIQAATARRDTTSTSSDASGRARAVVRLVWAGADPAGTLLDGRTATVHFTQNGDGSWNRTP
ncbi:hypothetical protein OV450_5604 [Actinobacteria bacterium OV450]|nr:hypothetical protein OV450_5604 [Actinobacteria bacterium OV450]